MTAPLPEWAVRSLSDAQRDARYLRHHGVAQPYGIGPNRSLTAAEQRDLAIIERAVDRLFRVDQRNRGER